VCSIAARQGAQLTAFTAANLDPGDERELARAFRQVSRECTLLVIAHRFSTVQAADHVIVLDQGQAVAAGSHQQLSRTNEYYRILAASGAQPAARHA